LYELETEICSDVECHLLHWVLFDWPLFIAILREHFNNWTTRSNFTEDCSS